MSTWKPLRIGDTVDIIAPAWACSKKELEKGCKLLESWGLNPRYSSSLLKSDFIFASSKKDRAKDLKNALVSKDSQAVLCLRGGSGTAEVLETLKNLKKPSKVKPVLGLSDITALHGFLIEKWNWPVIHGPMLYRLGNSKTPKVEVGEVKSLLFGSKKEVAFPNLTFFHKPKKIPLTIQAKIVGGNLKVYESGLGTFWECGASGKLLFLEDVNERGYAVYRSLVHLKQSGALRSIKGIVLGDFVGGLERNGQNLIWTAIRRFVVENNILTLKGVKSGHGKLQRCVPLNTRANLKLGRAPSLLIQSGCGK